MTDQEQDYDPYKGYNKNEEISSGNYINIPQNINIQIMPPPQPIQPSSQPSEQPIYIPPSVLSDNYQYVQKIINESKSVLDPIESQYLGSPMPLEPIRAPQNNEDKENDNVENQDNSSDCFAKCCAIFCQIILILTCIGLVLGVNATRQ